MNFIDDYQNTILFGIFLNFLTMFGFGLYKAANLSEDEMLSLVEKYEPKNDLAKLITFWIIPYLGYLYVCKEIWKLQMFLNKGLRIYDYLEYTLKNR